MSFSTIGMKKIILPLIILVILVGGIWYMKKNQAVLIDITMAGYKNSNLGISFIYPEILTASTTGGVVTLHHKVPFVHHDFCNWWIGFRRNFN